MARPRRDNLPVAVALVLSAGVHVIALGPMLSAVRAGADEEPLWTDTTPLESPAERIKLGLDEGVPSSLTWIGFTEYEEHLARLSETEQAAFAEAVPSEAPAPEAPVQPTPEAEPEPEPEAEPAEAEPTELTEAEPAAPEEGAPAEAAPALPAVDLAPLADIAGTVREETDRLFDAATDQLSRAWQSLRQARPRMRANEQSTEPTEPNQSAPPPTPEQPGEARAEKPAEPDATPADRESDATSIVEVDRDQWRAGKPLAAQGLTIITKKPEFQLWTLLTAAPRNPTVEVTFNHLGRVMDVRFARTSGHADVDRAIMLAVFAWRAEGERLSAFKEGETFTESITFLLTRRR